MFDKKTELFMRFFEENYGVKFVDAETSKPILKEEKDEVSSETRDIKES